MILVTDCVCSLDMRKYCCKRGKTERRRLLHFFLLSTVLVLTTSVLVIHSQYWKRLPSLPVLVQTFLPRARPRITGERDVYLCAIVRGRIGNAFFSYVSTLGVARVNNMTLLLKDESVLPEVLDHPPRTADRFEERCADALYVEQRRCCVFDERLVKLPHDDRYLIWGCLISWRYFMGQLQKDEVRSLLKFRPEVLTEAGTIVGQLRERTGAYATLVGMHVRRGDQAGFMAYWHGHNPVTPGYIQRAMHYFTDRFHNVHFLVASQDTSWCRKHVSRNRNDVTIMEGNSAAVDMAALMLTDHMIVSVGTFGWWAGFLNPGIKTYMRDFIGPRSRFAESFDDLNATDYIYPGWVGL